MTYVIRSGQPKALAEMGAKAWRLAALGHTGLLIPEWFVLSPRAFHASLTDTQRATIAGATGSGEIVSALADLRVADDVRQDLCEALRALCPDGERVAVRSSSSEEDSARHSFAGQLDSFLCVSLEDVPDRLALVWRSAFTERSVGYRLVHGLSQPPPAPSVLVQRMISADSAGVAFGADPVTGRRNMALICAVYGLGSSLVSGECDADTFRVSRDGHIIEREIVFKRMVHRAASDTAEGYRVYEVPDAQARQPVLDDDRVRQVAGLVLRASQHFGHPQDIEWAIERGRLYLLQSRPITTLGSGVDGDGVLRLWDNSNIAESYSGITTPLTFSFAHHVYDEVYREFCRLVGVPAAVIAAQDDTFRHMLGLIRGRVYYNLLSWYRLLATLPGFAVNRRFMEQMMGVREGVPDRLLPNPGSPTSAARLLDSIRLMRTTLGLIANHFLLPRRIERFSRRLDQALDPKIPLANLGADEIVAYYRDLESQLLKHWDAPLLNDFFTMVFYGALRRFVRAWCDDENGTLQNDLIIGEGGMISTEPARRIHEMALVAAGVQGLGLLLSEGPIDAIADAISRVPDFNAQYEEYLDKFGDRCLEELKLESPTVTDDPLMLVRTIGRLAQSLPSRASTLTKSAAPSGVRPQAGSARIDAERRVEQALRWRPDRRILFQVALKHARARVRDRENMRFERTRVFGRVRKIFLALGRRLEAIGAVDTAKDVFFLRVDEVFGFVDGTTVSTDLRGLVKLRKAEYASYSEGPPPDNRFETRGIVSLGSTFRFTGVSGKLNGNQRKGTGCCPGIVQGPVRVIMDPRHAVLCAGEILVTERTDPGWIVLFSTAAGLLVERGSLLSHSAIVAREMGIPAIVAIPELTRWLRDGDQVRLDGRTGVVDKLGQSEEASHAL